LAWSGWMGAKDTEKICRPKQDGEQD